MLDDEAAAAAGTTPVTVAVVDDDPTARRLMRFWLERAGYTVVEHDSARSALDHDGEIPALACVDLGLGEVTGIKVIQHLRARDSELPIIVVTAQRELETAVAAMQAGAYDYVTKPLDRDRLLLAVHRANERRELLSNVRRLESALTERSVLGSIVGQSPKMRELALSNGFTINPSSVEPGTLHVVLDLQRPAASAQAAG